MDNTNLKEILKDWKLMVQKYKKPDTKKATIQMLNSFLPFLGLLGLMHFSLNWSYSLTFIFALIAAFFLVRIFIIQHDCGHQSFLNSRKRNNTIGFIASLFTTIPFLYWSYEHNFHHAHNSKMGHEYRGIGNTYFMTKKEYQNSTIMKRIKYRLFRSPLVLFIFLPIYYFTIQLRYPSVRFKGWKKMRRPFFVNNLLIVFIYGALVWLIGWQKFLLIHVLILLIFSLIAFWFFYIQHQHEKNYKAWDTEWDHVLASIRGSTYYKLPRLFQWLTGNIGYHHIHHLSTRIPNYNLEACAIEHSQLNEFTTTLTFWQSLRCINHKLWDEDDQRMISFQELNTH